jgi:hypothetical protein
MVFAAAVASVEVTFVIAKKALKKMAFCRRFRAPDDTESVVRVASSVVMETPLPALTLLRRATRATNAFHFKLVFSESDMELSDCGPERDACNCVSCSGRSVGAVVVVPTMGALVGDAWTPPEVATVGALDAVGVVVTGAKETGASESVGAVVTGAYETGARVSVGAVVTGAYEIGARVSVGDAVTGAYETGAWESVGAVVTGANEIGEDESVG